MNFSSRRATSFHRAIQYILHDKDNPETDDRVSAVQFINLGTTDPAAEMLYTLEAARAIQARHRLQEGHREQSSGGDVKRPLYHFTLSWHPLDRPSDHTMLATARAAIAALGLSQHQAVLSCHNDRPHRHVHACISLIHPETGRVSSIRNDRWILDHFCHAYEAETVIRSFSRASRIERLPQNPRRAEAQKAAKIIQEQRQSARLTLARNQQVAREQRKDQFNTAHENYRADKKAVYDRYKELMNAVWKRDQPGIIKTFEPRKSLFAQKQEWMQLAKALKPADWISPRIRNTFRQADKAYVPHNTPNQGSRIFKWSRDAQTKDDLRPLQRGAPQLRGGRVIQPGRPWLTRKEQANHLKLARSAELGALALAHQKKVEGFEKAEIQAGKENEAEWLRFKKESATIWRAHKEEFAAPESKKEEPVREDFNNPNRANSPQLEPMTVQQFANDYIAGKGRDSKDHEQFAANNAAEIEKEFARRFKEPDHVQISPDEAIRQFTQFLRNEAGFDIREPITADGKYHNTALIGQKTGKSGGYILHVDGFINGQAKNHRTGITLKFTPNGERVTLSPAQRAKYEREHVANMERRNAQIQSQQNDAAKRAQLIWDQCQPASADHPYLKAKGLSPAGIRQCRTDLFMPRNDPSKPDINLNRALIIPRYDLSGKLKSIQAVTPTGFKMNMSGAQKNETAFILGRVEPGKPIAISEGYASGASVHQPTNITTAIAFDSGNLLHIAKAMRQKFPDNPILILADNDQWTFTAEGYEKAGRPDKDKIRGDDPRWQEWREAGYLFNPGMKAAQEAAEAVNGEVVSPDISPSHPDKITDWSDIFTRQGAESVQSAFASYIDAPENSAGLENSGPDFGM
jgi:phage/plasmid primase-like uncharacterized protein